MSTKAKVHGGLEGSELLELCSMNCSFLHLPPLFLFMNELGFYNNLQQLVAIAQRSQPFLLVVDNKPSEKMFSSGVIFACGFNGGERWGERQGSSPVIVHQKWQNCWLERA